MTPNGNKILISDGDDPLPTLCARSRTAAACAEVMTLADRLNDHILSGTDARQRTRLRLAIALSLGIILSGSAIALDANHEPWSQAAALAGLDDPRILRAMALAESGRVNGRDQIEPWPWALNIDGKAFYPTSRDEAVALISAHQDRSIDIGLLQINIRWHGHRVDDPRALLDPVVNLEIGAAILKEALASAPGDLTAGVGRYHSSDPERARSYARTVLAFYRYLIHGDEEMRDAR
ncbi:MAG: lytic transglycosylase domain-containing protein [Rhizobiales bacterium]|nr:lytic transglycosylase domain-containing protein [Hyphomicrobiales bacterium]